MIFFFYCVKDVFGIAYLLVWVFTEFLQCGEALLPAATELITARVCVSKGVVVFIGKI